MAKKPPSLKASLKRKTSANPAAAEMDAEAGGEPETKRLNVNVPAPLYEQFKSQADSEGRTMTWLVTRWIEDYLAD